MGSPRSPNYRFRVHSCKGANCNLRSSATFDAVDLSLTAPRLSFAGDLNPVGRQLLSTITLVPPSDAFGLQGYRAYWTNDGNTNLDAQPAPFALDLKKSCPPRPTAPYPQEDDDLDGTSWEDLAKAPCGNYSPFSPKCLGKSCTHISILPGTNGEWYISRRTLRVGGYGNAANPQSADMNHSFVHSDGRRNGCFRSSAHVSVRVVWFSRPCATSTCRASVCPPVLHLVNR